ncbi:MAG: hypothetical protein KDE63_09660, partial [Novosphingobium sp.]|nr:hypothetical protein [Novosphingobium sp.]
MFDRNPGVYRMKISRHGWLFARHSSSTKSGLLFRVVALLAIAMVQAVLIAPDAMAQRGTVLRSGGLSPDVANGAAIFITNKWTNWHLAVDQNGQLYEADPNTVDVNASWELQAVDGSPDVFKIRSKVYGRYLQMDNNDLSAGKLDNDGPYAHWTFEPVQGSLRIRNVGNPDLAINNQGDNEQRGPIRVSFVGEGWWSAMWNLQALSEQEQSQRAALIISQDNVPLTGMWRQTSSDFHVCPECRLAILATRFRSVDQEGAGGL